MKLAKTISILGMLAMTAVLIYGFTVGDFFGEGSKLFAMPWGIVSLVDLYTGFTLFSAWIIYREKSLPIAILWTVAMMTLGFFAEVYTSSSPCNPATVIGENSGSGSTPKKVTALSRAKPRQSGAGEKMKQQKWRELLDELRTVFAGRNSFLDAILPPIIFLLVNGLVSFQAAMWSALLLSIIIAVAQIIRKQSLLYALAGVGSVGIAIGIAWFLGRSEGFFLPGLISGSTTLLLALVSLVIRRPMVAWTSFLARRWPLEWYWHPQVRPAYSEVTFAWAIFFAARLFLQFSLFQSESVNLLGFTNFITGWPATILLLVFSYLYGTWRLAKLSGPSVDEFRNNAPSPWQGQRRGF